MARDISPYLLVLCETCSEEMNCHPASEMAWPEDFEGLPSSDGPICQECWEADDRDIDWHDLEPVVEPQRIEAPSLRRALFHAYRNGWDASGSRELKDAFQDYELPKAYLRGYRVD